MTKKNACAAALALCVATLPGAWGQANSNFEQRERDWRNGAVVYQVLVDRFAPSANLQAKRALYPPPKVLRDWSQSPARGTYLEAHKLWSHEIDFWGGDLQSLSSRLDYVQQLGADVLYLNPIHLAYTNHKYDALDYLKISPEFGTREDVKALAADVHRRGMKLVLDGVFNHMGRNSPYFKEAQADPKSPYRNWFVFGPQFPGGARAWVQAENLPELNLEEPKVREYVYGGADSVVRSYLRDGVDGWRLDVAFDIGPAFLTELTRAAHAQKPGSLIVGEIANYPQDWFPSVDGIMHFMLRHVMLRTAAGKLDAPTASRMIDRTITDAGIENMLKSWLYLDNHDTERLATVLPEERQRRLAQVLQFTLPGSPNLYYGSEVGMTGGDDPEMRGPMRWDLVAAGHPDLAWTKQLIGMHKQQRALRVGNYRPLVTRELLAFERHTERAADTVFVLANPGDKPVTELVMISSSKIMDGTRLVDLLGQLDAAKPLRVVSALLDVTVPPRTVYVLKPDLTPQGGYSNYKRVP
ncbi:MAG TPA: glycoside hydrolase family 13 protein [Rubrivivax sp.]|nr:glycoside hydrolase family 13 protein [Rubrivivax sp.]